MYEQRRVFRFKHCGITRVSSQRGGVPGAVLRASPATGSATFTQPAAALAQRMHAPLAQNLKVVVIELRAVVVVDIAIVLDAQ